jgi:hypothetical protein
VICVICGICGVPPLAARVPPGGHGLEARDTKKFCGGGRPKRARHPYREVEGTHHLRNGEPAMRLWLWDAGNYHGVTNDEDCALECAEHWMRDGDIARVELAILTTSFHRLSAEHVRTGTGWTGHRAAGAVTWTPLGVRPLTPRIAAPRMTSGRFGAPAGPRCAQAA